ncbi:zinc-binding dehydrogenase [Lacrimispora sp.]|uniref:zinc-binding dehydrogenase n=1 Tax=Lacrimispora sp. TaxID=2719234 RepID=UPI002896C73A|nr:zinc-binding dehydrogenase [Lacrimispora sp.]
MGAKLMGATIAVSDISEGHLQVAREMGADDVTVTNKDNFDERVRELTGGVDKAFLSFIYG